MIDDSLEESLSDMNNDVSESALELVSLMQTFMDDYFSDEYEVLRFNINFLESNGFTYQTKIDYRKLNRFVSAAFNTIQSNDIQVIDALISKFYKDVVFLNNFYKSFLDKSKDAHIIFKHQFLKPYGGIEGLYKFLDSKDAKEGYKYKAPSEEELSSFEEYVKEEFRLGFVKESENYNTELRTIINTKTYYFDKLLWCEAKKSLSIREFFKKSKRSDSDISDELSTKIFIKQYMNTVDLSHAKDARWHQYLENVLTIMD